MSKNGNTVEVTQSAYDNYFKNAGWELVNKPAPQPIKNNKSKVEETKEIDEWSDYEDDVTKPISEMNREELVDYANKNGIDITGLIKNNQIREAIKAAM